MDIESKPKQTRQLIFLYITDLQYMASRLVERSGKYGRKKGYRSFLEKEDERNKGEHTGDGGCSSNVEL